MTLLESHNVLKLLLLLSLISPFLSIVLYKRYDITQDSEKNNGNQCVESHPWPCKNGKCIAFDFICDGTPECDDGYDENPDLCTAKDRPAFELLDRFLRNNKQWLVPKYLGDAGISQITMNLIESKTIDIYANRLKLTNEQRDNMIKMLKAVEAGRRIEMMLMGMPPNQWEDVKDYFGRIIHSGFLSSIE